MSYARCRKDDAATEWDCGVPISDTESPMSSDGSEHQFRCDGNDGKSHERFHQIDRLLVGQQTGAGITSGLNVEFCRT